ncbi:MAG TPA: hypothetical protein VF783_14325 [Terriglobales bacterium]
MLNENNPLQLLEEMPKKKVMVEICLSSNATVLAVSGKAHPLHDYMRAGVPVALATDDEGVSRSDLTHEYLRGVEEQNLTYLELKRMARTSLGACVCFRSQPVGRRQDICAGERLCGSRIGRDCTGCVPEICGWK